jgi:hypothetical protein
MDQAELQYIYNQRDDLIKDCLPAIARLPFKKFFTFFKQTDDYLEVCTLPEEKQLPLINLVWAETRVAAAVNYYLSLNMYKNVGNLHSTMSASQEKRFIDSLPVLDSSQTKH